MLESRKISLDKNGTFWYNKGKKGKGNHNQKEELIMKKTIKRIAMAIFTALILASMAHTEAAKRTVAVMPVENISGYSAGNVADIMTEQLMTVLNHSGSYTVTERTQLGSVLKELGFQSTGAVDPNQAIEIGQMTGAQYSLIGKVTMAEVTRNQTANLFDAAVQAFGGTRSVSGYVGNSRSKISLNVRLIDNRTGESVLSMQVDGAKSGNEPMAAFHGACKEAANRVLKNLRESTPAVAYVMDTDLNTNSVYIDQGTESGFKKGDRLTIVRNGRTLTNESGEVVTVLQDVLGKVEVVHADAGYSVCKIIEQSTFIMRGDFARKS